MYINKNKGYRAIERITEMRNRDDETTERNKYIGEYE